MTKIICPHCNKEFEPVIEKLEEEPMIVEVRGYKGKGKIEIVSIDKNKRKLILRQWHKEKETSESYYQDSDVFFDDLEFVWDLLKEHCQIGQEYGSHYVWRLIINAKKLNEIEGVPEDYIIKHFLGYRQKKGGTDYYFRYYFNPIKVFEKWGKLQFFGRGGVMLIDSEDLDFRNIFKDNLRRLLDEK